MKLQADDYQVLDEALDAWIEKIVVTVLWLVAWLLIVFTLEWMGMK